METNIDLIMNSTTIDTNILMQQEMIYFDLVREHISKLDYKISSKITSFVINIDCKNWVKHNYYATEVNRYGMDVFTNYIITEHNFGELADKMIEVTKEFINKYDSNGEIMTLHFSTFGSNVGDSSMKLYSGRKAIYIS